MYKGVPCSIIWGYMKSEATWLPISETWIEKMWWMNAWKTRHWGEAMGLDNIESIVLVEDEATG